MEKNKRTILFIFLAIAYFFVFMRGNKETEPEKVDYKTGVLYEKVAVRKGNFITNFISSFQKQEARTLNNVDILKITYENDRIENIQIEKAVLLAGKEESAHKFFDSIIKEQNLKSKELVISDDLKEISNDLIRALENSRSKAISALKEKVTVKKLKIGTFSSIVKNEEQDQFMEVTIVFTDIKISNIDVIQNNLTNESIELIEKSIENILNEEIKTLEDVESIDSGYSTFIRGVNEIQDQLEMKSFETTPQKGNPIFEPFRIIWQFIKNTIAGLINMTYNVVKNYGIAIIVATIIIKVILMPLTLKQDKSMKKMKKFQPQLEAIKEKYKNDPQTMNQKTMEIYKENKINPAAGCFPLLLQMPILIALFGVLRGGVIPETAMVFNNIINFDLTIITNIINGVLIGPRFLWLDLVNPDPFYVLPILTGAVTYLQQKTMNAGGGGDNPMMKNMSVMMPLMMVFIGLRMPSGVQLYWLISTALAVIQQRWIIKKGE